MDLGKMDTLSLKKLQTRVEREITRREKRDRLQLLREFKKMAGEKGLNVNELLDDEKPHVQSGIKSASRAKQKKKTKMPAVYFNPQNPDEGWSGHGRKPTWIIDWMTRNHGASLDTLKRPGTA